MMLVVVGTILVFIFRHSIKTVLKTIVTWLLTYFCPSGSLLVLSWILAGFCFKFFFTLVFVLRHLVENYFFSRCTDCEFSVHRGEETSGDGERSSDKTRPTFGTFILCAMDGKNAEDATSKGFEQPHSIEEVCGDWNLRCSVTSLTHLN